MDREYVETVVTDALKSRLMPPALCKAFTQAYFERRKQNRAQQDSALRDQRMELTRIEKEIANLVQAIKSGVDAAFLRDEIDTTQRRKTELTAALATKPETQPLLHANMGEYYHRQIQRLIEWLNEPSRREEAAHIVRQLIQKIVLTPTPDRKELSIDLYGDLAEILLIAASNDAKHKIRNYGGLSHAQSVEIEQIQGMLGDCQTVTEGFTALVQAPVVAGAGAALAQPA
jgi:predicted transposase YbfD/YdcC